MQNEKSDILKTVTTVIAQALKVDEAQVQPGSSLIRDLGAESIDFLDIVFRLEKAFKIKIPKGELFPEKLLTDARFVQEGKVTAAGLEELKKRLSGADWTQFEKNPQVSSLGDLFTVGMIVEYLSGKLAATNR
ncbi:MAG: Acyl carrier protein [Candidatus Omnitrophica bacterium]|nr:Acyl carrier protein [Candidatus Omnitrophota bacterium]